jgi:putative ABC transport system permease protein
VQQKVLITSLSRLAWRNLQRNKRRNLATGVAITTGFMAFMLAAGYATRIHNVLRSYTIYGLRSGHISIYKAGALEMYAIKPKEWSLTKEQQVQIESELKADDRIVQFGRILRGQGIVGNGCKSFPFLATGVDLAAEKYAGTHPDIQKYSPHITELRVGGGLWDYSKELPPVAVSLGLAKLLGKAKIHDQIPASQPMKVINCSDPDAREHFADDANVQLASGTWDGQLNASDGEMVQMYSTGLVETNNSSLTTTIEQLQSLYATDHVTSYSVWLENVEDTKDVLKQLRSKLLKNFEVLAWNEERVGPYYVGTMRFIVTMVSFIGCVLAAVIILSIFNSATMTVIERSEEVGMLRSIGYTKRLIRIIFALEGFFLTMISVVVGLILGLLAMYTISHLGIKFRPPGVEGGINLILVPNIVVIGVASLFVSGLGVSATWFAVLGIAKKNIAELVAGTHR